MWVVFLICWAGGGVLVVRSNRNGKNSSAYLSFAGRLQTNSRWWLAGQTASYCQKNANLLARVAKGKVEMVCPQNCSSKFEQDFTVYNIPNVDYAALFDRVGSALALWVVSMIADIFVIGYHVRNRPHPKFMLTKKRVVSITFHALSGSGECMTGLWVAFLKGDERIAMMYYMLVFSLVHIVTAMLQTDIVFGAKKVMIPAYVCAVFFKIFCWFKLMTHLLAKNDEVLVMSWFLSLELIHHIYVWVRVFIWFSSRARLFRKNQYTVSICLAGMMCVFPALGFGGLFCFWGVVYVYQYIWPYFVRDKWARVFYAAELDRNPFFSDLYRGRAVHALLTILPSELYYARKTSFSMEWANLSENDQAAYTFKILDTDNSGHISVTEIANVLINWGCPQSDAKKAMQATQIEASTRIDEALFKAKFFDLWAFSDTCFKELSTILDEKTVLPDGTMYPYEKIDEATIFSDMTRHSTYSEDNRERMRMRVQSRIHHLPGKVKIGPKISPFTPEEWEEQMLEKTNISEDCSITPEEWKEKMLEKIIEYPDQFQSTLGDAESGTKNFNI
jgi:hypothetical protein